MESPEYKSHVMVYEDPETGFQAEIHPPNPVKQE
jgi:hypothetical protein